MGLRDEQHASLQVLHAETQWGSTVCDEGRGKVTSLCDVRIQVLLVWFILQKAGITSNTLIFNGLEYYITNIYKTVKQTMILDVKAQMLTALPYRIAHKLYYLCSFLTKN